jgi:hypothetical protein
MIKNRSDLITNTHNSILYGLLPSIIELGNLCNHNEVTHQNKNIKRLKALVMTWAKVISAVKLEPNRYY